MQTLFRVRHINSFGAIFLKSQADPSTRKKSIESSGAQREHACSFMETLF
jgi:hypothetical protein